jgi:hypothetical protein
MQEDLSRLVGHERFEMKPVLERAAGSTSRLNWSSPTSTAGGWSRCSTAAAAPFGALAPLAARPAQEGD